MSNKHGRCHCGQVDYDVTIPDGDSHILCHCSACKYVSGGEFTMNHPIPSKNLKINRGELGEYTYVGDSGHPVHCYYCRNCTSHIYHHPESAGDTFMLRTATVDQSRDWPVDAEVQVACKAKWQPTIAPKERAYEAAPPGA
ncbi:hypothetical protein KEM52_003357 [Ascosphaera acerosa]|nr:hypothetical protein KEM52_003357 [Ascosphaera acerosa]